MRADRTIRPQASLDVGVGGFFVVEVRGGEVRHGEVPCYAYLSASSGYVKYNIANDLAIAAKNAAAKLRLGVYKLLSQPFARE